MSFACKNGAKECTACRLCFSASVCEICGRAIPTGRLYYELSEKMICENCIEAYTADEDTVCNLCEDTITEGEMLYIYNDKAYCACCISASGRKKDYV